ncbi:MAG: hypothetical protein AAGF67_16080 [Verrucomicrobiota bacterium]
MKFRIFTTLIFLAYGCSFAGVETEEVTVKLGPKYFRDGDVIRIDSVESTSPNLEPGDQVTVHGKYRLDSQKEAMLALFLTQTEGDGLEETDSTQWIDAKRGWREFCVSITIKHRGYLHLSFYDQDTGQGFGGVYFGTAKQISEKMVVSVDDFTK